MVISAAAMAVVAMVGGPVVGVAGAAGPAGSPLVIGGEAWCGHFDHARATSLPAHFTCPTPEGTADPSLVPAVDPSPLTSVTLVTPAPNGPFSSGQYVNVVVAPNTVLQPGRHVYIRECAAPGGVLPTSLHQCDTRTIQDGSVTVGPNGTVDYVGYPIYALPDSIVLGESSHHKPVCDLTHACVVLVGQGRHRFDKPHVFSLAFYVHPTPGDSGVDPGNGLPEVPSVLALPLIAVALLGGTVALRRRRNRLGRPVG